VFLKSRYPDVYSVDGGPPVATLEGFRSGEFAVQDETATAPVRSMRLEPGMLVLDACAAPGGKTVQAADAMAGRGVVVAADPDRGRLARLLDNAARTGARTIMCVCADSRRPPFRQGSFDRVLVDAPCSNTGVLRRRAEARFRLSAAALEAIAADQSGLVEACAPLVKPGGLMVYSTCSVDPSENQGVVEAFASSALGFRVVFEEAVLPGEADGGYHAVIVKDLPGVPESARAPGASGS
jgi:16S rRNA (cytosine967-C5)-methyltransferase